MSVYELGEQRPVFEGFAFVAPNASVIGDVVLGDGANVWFNAVLRGDNDRITLGRNVNVQDGAVLHIDPGHPLTLEDGASIGHNAMVHGCHIGANVLIGINAVVLNDAVIGADSLIGANALIPERKEIPPRSLVVGSPGRVVRELNDDEVAALRQTSVSYLEKAHRYSTQLTEVDSRR